MHGCRRWTYDRAVPVRFLIVLWVAATASCKPSERAARSNDSAPPAAAEVFAPDPNFALPVRAGPPPEVSDAPAGTNIAQRQLTQRASVELQEALFARAASLPDVQIAPSRVSVPGARAFVLAAGAARGPRDAFQVETEFAHLHPADDGSLHMKLPPSVAAEVFTRGWGVPHPRSGTPLIFGPRDGAELEVVWQLLLRSHAWAREGRAVPTRSAPGTR
jgi:phospholipase/carboxylesterase